MTRNVAETGGTRPRGLPDVSARLQPDEQLLGVLERVREVRRLQLARKILTGWERSSRASKKTRPFRPTSCIRSELQRTLLASVLTHQPKQVDPG